MLEEKKFKTFLIKIKKKKIEKNKAIRIVIERV